MNVPGTESDPTLAELLRELQSATGDGLVKWEMIGSADSPSFIVDFADSSVILTRIGDMYQASMIKRPGTLIIARYSEKASQSSLGALFSMARDQVMDVRGTVNRALNELRSRKPKRG